MYKCKFCGKEFEKKQQLAGHIIWCKENPNKSGKCNFNANKENRPALYYNLFCRYCGKPIGNPGCLVTHERSCKLSPNYVPTQREIRSKNKKTKTMDR